MRNLNQTLFWILLAGWSLLQSGCIGTDVVDEVIGQDQSSLQLEQENISLLIGQTQSLKATYYNEAGIEMQTPLDWISENPSIATVSTDGLVTAKALGQTGIVVSTEDQITARALVTVVADVNAVASVTISGSTNQLQPSASLQLTATVRSAGGQVITGNPVSWNSSNTAVATVNSSGSVTAIANGQTQITATVNGVNSLPYIISVGSSQRQGSFVGVGGHSVSGSATVTNGANGYVVNLSANFMTQAGPALHVYLGKSGTSGANGVDLGELQSNSGAQTYTIPANVNQANFTHVLIYCQPFGVVFGAAALQ